MVEIWNIQVDCVSGCYLEEPSKKVCEIQNTYQLKNLCYFILESFDFEDDHLHQFFISSSIHNRDHVIRDETTPLSKIFPLEHKQFLFLNFDYGDDWIFKIKHTQKKVQHNEKLDYPRVMKHLGKNPEQYPMYEDYN